MGLTNHYNLTYESPTSTGVGGQALDANFAELNTRGGPCNWSATTDPITTSDSAHNFLPGSKWFNTSSGVLWFCVDATPGAAVWKSLLPNLQSVTDVGATTTDLTAFTGGLTGGSTGQFSVDPSGNTEVFSLIIPAGGTIWTFQAGSGGSPGGGTSLVLTNNDSGNSFTFEDGGGLDLGTYGLTAGGVIILGGFIIGAVPTEVDGGLVYLSDIPGVFAGINGNWMNMITQDQSANLNLPYGYGGTSPTNPATPVGWLSVKGYGGGLFWIPIYT